MFSVVVVRPSLRKDKLEDNEFNEATYQLCSDKVRNDSGFDH